MTLWITARVRVDVKQQRFVVRTDRCIIAEPVGIGLGDHEPPGKADIHFVVIKRRHRDCDRDSSCRIEGTQYTVVHETWCHFVSVITIIRRVQPLSNVSWDMDPTEFLERSLVARDGGRILIFPSHFGGRRETQFVKEEIRNVRRCILD